MPFSNGSLYFQRVLTACSTVWPLAPTLQYKDLVVKADSGIDKAVTGSWESQSLIIRSVRICAELRCVYYAMDLET